MPIAPEDKKNKHLATKFINFIHTCNRIETNFAPVSDILLYLFN